MSADEMKKELVVVSDIYPDNITIIPLETRPVFPGLTMPFSFMGGGVEKAVKYAIDKNEGFIGASLGKQINNNDYINSSIYKIGVLLKITKVVSSEIEGMVNFQAEALSRIRIMKSKEIDGIKLWNVQYIYENNFTVAEEVKAYTLAIINSVKELIRFSPMFQEQIRMVVTQIGVEKPGLLMDVLASFTSANKEKLQELLEILDLSHRAEKLLVLLKEEIELNKLQKDIERQIEDKISDQQREYFLREQLKIIKKELGLEKDDTEAEIEKINQKIAKLNLSDEVFKVLEDEVDKLKVLDTSSPEYQVTRNYINWLTDIPWGVYSKDSKDVVKAHKILDSQHYGLQDVKDRILEFMSTIIKRGKVSGSIICLVGPPGTGKTSIGRSIAESLGRKFYRFSLGGMRDEAEIKGHRRTYIGAMPGKIIQSLKTCATSNPLIMLDEIDKLGVSFQGDPASALLEVLDPEQNSDFLDHYIDVRFDLSNVLFITTANMLDTIPRPLLDRMEVIKLSGYIQEEKVEIAKRFLIPKQLKEHGLDKTEVTISDSALITIIEGYARAAGVRDIENQIKKIMRKATLILAKKKEKKVKISKKNVSDYIGKPYFYTEELYNKKIPGVALGLAWTNYGGATLYIEAAANKGTKGFKQTGQLGSVMRESSEIAYSYIITLLSGKVESTFFKDNFIHLHVPEGATPKDGPSAGITMALALYSLATDKAVKVNLAMTGELTLTGKVLPIGGVKEKVIAARRVKINELIFPEANKNDFDDLPEYLKKGLSVNFVSDFKEVLKLAFD